MAQPAYPPNVLHLLRAAAQLLQAGRPGDAVGPLGEAARLAPQDAAILHDLGLACLESGRLAEAIAALQGAVAARPRYADAHLRLGIALEACGAPEAALAAYRKASDLEPKLADAHYRTGDLLQGLGQMARAGRAYRRAAAAAPDTTLGRLATARALLGENRDAQAEAVLREALRFEPENAIALELLGNLMADAGQFEAARETLLRAIERAPLRAGSYDDVVRCRRIGPQDHALIAAMRAALTRPELEAAPRARVHLALGKAAADLGDAQTAMREWDQAQAIRDGLARFDLAAFEARVERLMAAFPAERFARTQRQSQPGPAPILIVGLPRSGTTLVEQILSSHGEVGAGGELSFWNERGFAWERAGAGAPKARFLREAAADYRRLLRGVAPGAAHVTDKMPLNFQWAGLIHLALPEAMILHCRRAPIDTALSIHRTHFNPRIAFPTGGAALVGYIRAYQRLCDHWRRVLPDGQFIDIDYEALTGDPQTTIRHMVGACRLPWDEACLYPERNDSVIKTPSKWQARQKIYGHAVGGWREYEPWLGPLLALKEGSLLF